MDGPGRQGLEGDPRLRFLSHELLGFVGKKIVNVIVELVDNVNQIDINYKFVDGISGFSATLDTESLFPKV